MLNDKFLIISKNKCKLIHFHTFHAICPELKFRWIFMFIQNHIDITKLNFFKYQKNAHVNIPFIEYASFHVYLELLNNMWYHIKYKKLLLLFIFWETFMSFQFNHMVWKWLQLAFIWYTDFYIKREGLKLIDKTLRNFPLYSSYLFCQSFAYIIFPPFHWLILCTCRNT